MTQAEGGAIPGDAGPAFVLHRPMPAPIPVVIAVPHAGRAYPPGLLAAMRQPAQAAQRLEDRLVDLVAQAVARQTGAALLIARAPRAMIDLNRAPDDLDREMILPDPALPDFPPVARGPMAARRAHSGLGLVPRRLAGLGDIWRQRTPAAEIQARITGIHAPYHLALAQVLADLASRWGAALLIDLHSMPPLARREEGELPPTYVLGDRFGAACAGPLMAAAFAHLAACGARAAHNRPYAGGYGLERQARREAGVHAVQVEIDRSAYLDAALAEPGAGLADVVETVTGLVRVLAGEVAALGQAAQRWPRAAE
ncbi:MULTISPECIES: N-formylglutamate amidohydrolase [unclassified Novosphingobium]|uniref:N-formylglutamate amidohydrolase n=1 Tax=Novosphingobium TaxID=165696 RepID=UPI001799A888|nr:N-formylglutamate amidohydrolase [Novosphingobium sp. SG720]NMN03484.1 N-formylglutamate amidohydrolase [Novosphingobium sp. SG919]NMN86526.1 N-formylglutamate amidohydrolase [Novosphingobium sp. SG916]